LGWWGKKKKNGEPGEDNKKNLPGAIRKMGFEEKGLIKVLRRGCSQRASFLRWEEDNGGLLGREDRG